MYADELADWRSFSFQAQTRSGTAIEWAWCNYPEPTELHEYTFVGKDYRARERITRQQKRWVLRLAKLPVLERKAMFEKLTGAMEEIGA